MRYLKTPDAAVYLGMGVSTLERLRVEGSGPRFHKLGSKAVRYRVDDLDTWAKPATSTSEGIAA
jgi:predicted DNA-binding transcriptional regulator AlpA